MNLIKNTCVARRILAMILILTAILPAAAYAGGDTYINLSKAKVYQSASTSARSVTLSAGTVVEKTDAFGSWIEVEKNGCTGYMKASSLTELKDFEGATAYITEKTALYKSYGSSRKHCTLSEGAAVKVYSATPEWAYVAYKNNKGFVRFETLSADKPEAEKEESLRMTGYVATDSAKVYRSHSTSSKVICTLDVNTEVTVTGVSNGWCRVENGKNIAYMRTRDLSTEKVAVDNDDIVTEDPFYELNEDAADTAPSVSTNVPEGATAGDSSATSARGTAVEMDWWTSDIQNIMKVGTVVTITDVATGISWREKRTGGKNHADCQPLTAEDTAAMLAACGSWSWTRRPIFVTIDGVNYAASMNCMPHSSDSISGNNFDGHHCIHFTNSRTHTGNKVCSLHQAAIQKATAAVL